MDFRQEDNAVSDHVIDPLLADLYGAVAAGCFIFMYCYRIKNHHKWVFS